jgi:hypothetical protein
MRWIFLFPCNTANGPTGRAKEEARELAIERFRLIQPHLEDDRPLKAVAINGRKALRYQGATTVMSSQETSEFLKSIDTGHLEVYWKSPELLP